MQRLVAVGTAWLAVVTFLVSIAHGQELDFDGPNGGFALVETISCDGRTVTLRVNAPAGSAPVLSVGNENLVLPSDAALNYGGVHCMAADGGARVAVTMSQGNARERFLLFDSATLAVQPMSHPEWQELRIP